MSKTRTETIEDRYEKRKKAKKNFDRMITLSSNPKDKKQSFKLSVSTKDQKVRLLDEGVVVDSEGYPLFYIKRGVLEKYYNSLPDDFDGDIVLGHLDYSTFPISLGTWSKKDLTLVDIGDGRKALDVDMKLNTDLYIVKDLMNDTNPKAVSAEFFAETNWDESDSMNLQVVESVDIGDFAVVGEGGNVNSGGLKLNVNKEGGEDMKDKNFMQGLISKYLTVDKKEDEPKVEDLKVDQDEKVEGENLEQFVEKFETLINDHEQALEVISKMSDELEETKKELEDTSKQLSAYKTSVPNTLEKLKMLSAKVGGSDEQLKAKQKTSDGKISSNGWGTL
jgi:hypothetical protein